ncbi:MAG: GNAT family N-acetyltransferase [Candidatus Lokiarchaeota archaeon]|nr:GNAT family N-acetyltransferase [Candidatus Lokiarchaeota archaeon]
MFFREFKDKDAKFCFTTRCSSFVEKFYDEIGAKAVSTGINAYLPEDYITISKKSKIFIIEDDSKKIGFITIKKVDEKTAEIPFLYINLAYLGKGYGKKLIQFTENWVKNNWIDVITIFLDTIVQDYNGGFYRKMDYKEIGDSVCQYDDYSVKARRFEKKIK